MSFDHLGQKVRYLREKSGLSRNQFEKKFGISVNTLKSFETGQREITSSKEILLKNIFNTLGFDLNYPLAEAENGSIAKQEKPAILNKTEINIKLEIDYFKQLNPNYVLYTIGDTGMSPLFCIGDIVGGEQFSHKDMFAKFTGLICIVTTYESTKFIGRIMECKKDSVLISPHNYQSLSSTPLTEVKNTMSVAQVTRHWCLNSLQRFQ